MNPGRHQTGKMRHIDHEQRTDGIGDLAKPREIDDPWISRAAGNDQFRLVLVGQPLDLFIIDLGCILAHAILHCIEPLP